MKMTKIGKIKVDKNKVLKAVTIGGVAVASGVVGVLLGRYIFSDASIFDTSVSLTPFQFDDTGEYGIAMCSKSFFKGLTTNHVVHQMTEEGAKEFARTLMDTYERVYSMNRQ